ncbi:hypothetical protein SynBIOSE41_03917 [Synechococcus sp. BIOS-E4-1]|nr:hypothetical protein SynBIOSE41_03917 [Synechococcus sp. BIOS-E4-1]
MNGFLAIQGSSLLADSEHWSASFHTQVIRALLPMESRQD